MILITLSQELQQEILTLQINFMAEEFLTVLAHHCLLGEIARAKNILTTPAGNSISQPVKQLLNGLFSLALGHISDGLNQLKDVQGDAYLLMAQVTEILYLRSCAIQDQERIEILQQNIDIEISNAQPQILILSFISCCVFDSKYFVQLCEPLNSQDESLNAALFISEQYSQQTPTKLDKFYQKMRGQNLGAPNQLVMYAEIIKAIFDNSSDLQTQMGPQLRAKAPMLYTVFQDSIHLIQWPIQENFQLLQYVQQQKGSSSLEEYIKSQFQNPFNKLILNLVTSNFEKEPNAIVQINQQLELINTKIIGKLQLQSQKDRISTLLIQIARAFPTNQCLNAIVEFIDQNLEPGKNKQLNLLKGYILGVQALLSDSTQIAQKSLEIYNEIFSTSENINLQTKDDFIFNTDDIFVLIQGLLGRQEEVRQQLSELVRSQNLDYNNMEEEEQDTSRQPVSDLLSPSVTYLMYKKHGRGDGSLQNVLQALPGNFQRQYKKQIYGFSKQACDISYGQLLPDILGISVLGSWVFDSWDSDQRIGGSQHNQHLTAINTATLQNAAFCFIQTCNLSISSVKVRMGLQALWCALQAPDPLLSMVSELSAFSSAENNSAVTPRELVSAAGAAAAVQRHGDAETYVSHALLLDAGISKTTEFQKVDARILAAKGDYKGALERLSGVLNELSGAYGDGYDVIELVALRAHIALLQIKGNDLVGGFEIFKQLQQCFPPATTAAETSSVMGKKEQIASQLTVAKAKASLYILKCAGLFGNQNNGNSNNQQKALKSAYDDILEEYAILFYEDQDLISKLLEHLQTTFQEGRGTADRYIGAVYGPCPVRTSADIFSITEHKESKQQEKGIDQEVASQFCSGNRVSLDAVLKSLQPYIQTSIEATELLGRVKLLLLGDKIGYVQCYSQLTKAAPCTARLAALASAYLAVGNAKDAEIYYQKAINTAKDVCRAQQVDVPSEILIITFLSLLRARALGRCHRYKECSEALGLLLESGGVERIAYDGSAAATAEIRRERSARLIVYAMISIEYMKLLIKLRSYDSLGQISDKIALICQQKFGVPLDIKGVSAQEITTLPLMIVYLSCYCTRAKATLYQMGHCLPMRGGAVQKQAVQEERLQLLTKCCYFVDHNIALKTSRSLPAKLNLKIRMCPTQFSTQPTQIIDEALYSQSELVGLRGLILQAELRVEMAEYYLDQAKVDITRLSDELVTQQTISQERKQDVRKAQDNAKLSLRACSARGEVLVGACEILLGGSLESARESAVNARTLEPFNTTALQLLQAVSRKMTFGAGSSEVDSEAANTPFDDATRILKVGLDVDRAKALDVFMLNSCLVHDMTIVTQALFQQNNIGSNQNHHKLDDHDFNELSAVAGDCTTLAEVSNAIERGVGKETTKNTENTATSAFNPQNTGINQKQGFDGYFYLGRGVLSLKMGRTLEAFQDLQAASNGQTLSDRYRCRALFLLGTIYINPGRTPLYGASSALAGRQQSAISLQKAAMNARQNNTQYIDEVVQQFEVDDVTVPDRETLNQRDEDIQEAIQLLATLEQLGIKDVSEGEELAAILRCLVRVAQYRQAKDKIARVLLDEGKIQGKSKLQQLEAIKDEARAQLSEQTEALHNVLNSLPATACNRVVLLYALGVAYVHLKNEAKARTSFQSGAKTISSVRDVGQGEGGQTMWLDVDAAVQCNLALADQYIGIGKITNALKALDAVASLDKIQTTSYELYGLCMEKEAAFEDAVRYYESAWLLSRGSPSVAYRLAYNYMKAERYEDAALMCQTALTEWPSFMKLRKEVLFRAETAIKSKARVPH